MPALVKNKLQFTKLQNTTYIYNKMAYQLISSCAIHLQPTHIPADFNPITELYFPRL